MSRELLAWSRCHIWSLRGSNGIWIRNHLVCKRTLNWLIFHKLLSCVVSICLYGVFDCMFLPCHARVSEWIYTLICLNIKGIPCKKQIPYLKFKWQQRDLNPQLPSSQTNTQSFSQTSLVKWLSVRLRTE